AMDNDNENTGYIKTFNEKAVKNLQEVSKQNKDIATVAGNRLFEERKNKAEEGEEKTEEYNISNDVETIEDIKKQPIPVYDETRRDDSSYDYQAELNKYGLSLISAYNNAVICMENYLGNEHADIPDVLRAKINSILSACKAERSKLCNGFNNLIFEENKTAGMSWGNLIRSASSEVKEIEINDERDIIREGSEKAYYRIKGNKKVTLAQHIPDVNSVIENALNDYKNGKTTVKESNKVYDSLLDSAIEALRSDIASDENVFRDIAAFFSSLENGADYINFAYLNKDKQGNSGFLKFISELALLDDNQKSRNGERNIYINKVLGDIVCGFKTYAAAMDNEIPLDADMNKNAEATSRFADMLGIGQIVNRSRNVKCLINGNEENCLVEDISYGHTLKAHKEENKPGKDINNILGVIKIFDFLCGRTKRSEDSVYISTNNFGVMNGVSITNNQLSFGNKDTLTLIDEGNINKDIIRSLPAKFIDELKKMDESTPELLLGDLLEKSQIDSFKSRVKYLIDEISSIEKETLDKENSLKDSKEIEEFEKNEYFMADDTYRYLYYMVKAYDSGVDMEKAGYNTDMIYDKETAKSRLSAQEAFLLTQYAQDKATGAYKKAYVAIAKTRYAERNGLDGFRRNALVLEENTGSVESVEAQIRQIRIPNIQDLTDEELIKLDHKKEIDEIKQNTVIPLKSAFLRMVAYGKVTDLQEINHYKAIIMSFEQMESYYDMRIAALAGKEGWGAEYSKHNITISTEELIRRNEELLKDNDEIDKAKYLQMYQKLHPGKTLSKDKINSKMIQVRKNIGKKEYYAMVNKTLNVFALIPEEYFPENGPKRLEKRSIGSFLSLEKKTIHVEEPVLNEQGVVVGYEDKVVPYTNEMVQTLIANLNSDDRDKKHLAFKQMLYQLKFLNLGIFDDTKDEESIHSKLMEKRAIGRKLTELKDFTDLIAASGYRMSADEYRTLKELGIFGQRMLTGVAFETQYIDREDSEYILDEDIESITDSDVKKKFIDDSNDAAVVTDIEDINLRQTFDLRKMLKGMEGKVVYKPGVDMAFEKKFVKAFGPYDGKAAMYNDQNISDTYKDLTDKKKMLGKEDLFSNIKYDSNAKTVEEIKEDQKKYIDNALEFLSKNDILKISSKGPAYVTRLFGLYKKGKEYAEEIKKSVKKYNIELDQETTDYIDNTIKAYDRMEPYALMYMKLVQMPGYVSLCAKGMVLPPKRIDSGYSSTFIKSRWIKRAENKEERDACQLWSELSEYWGTKIAAFEKEYMEDLGRSLLNTENKPFIPDEYEISNDYMLKFECYRSGMIEYFRANGEKDGVLFGGNYRKISNTIACMSLLKGLSVEEGYEYYKKGSSNINFPTATDENLENYKEFAEWVFDYFKDLDISIFDMDNESQVYEDFEKKYTICMMAFDFMDLLKNYMDIHESGRLNDLKYNAQVIDEVKAKVDSIHVFMNKFGTYGILSLFKIHKTNLGHELRAMSGEDLAKQHSIYKKYLYDKGYAKKHPELNIDEENANEIFYYIEQLLTYTPFKEMEANHYLSDGNATLTYEESKESAINDRKNICKLAKDAVKEADIEPERSVLKETRSKAKYRVDDEDKCDKLEAAVCAYTLLHDRSIETATDLQNMLELDEEKTHDNVYANKLKVIELFLLEVLSWDVSEFDFRNDIRFTESKYDNYFKNRLKKLQMVEGMKYMVDDYEKLILKGVPSAKFTQDDINEIKARLTVYTDTKKIYDLKIAVLTSEYYEQGIKDKIDIMSVKELKVFSKNIKDNEYVKHINNIIAVKEANSAKSNLKFKVDTKSKKVIEEEAKKINPKHEFDEKKLKDINTLGISTDYISNGTTDVSNTALAKYYTISVVSGDISDTYMTDKEKRKELIIKYAKDFDIEPTEEYIKEVEDKFEDKYRLSKKLSAKYNKVNDELFDNAKSFKSDFKKAYTRQILGNEALLSKLKEKYKAENKVNEVSDETVADFYSNINLPRAAISLLSLPGISEEDKYEIMYMSVFGQRALNSFKQLKGVKNRGIKASKTELKFKTNDENDAPIDEEKEKEVILEAKRIWKSKVKLVKIFAGFDLNRFKFDSLKDLEDRADELPELMFAITAASEQQNLIEDLSDISLYDFLDEDAPAVTKEELVKAGTFINATMSLNQGLMNQIRVMVTPAYSLIDTDKIWENQELLDQDTNTEDPQEGAKVLERKKSQEKLKKAMETNDRKKDPASINLYKQISRLKDGRGLHGTMKDNFAEMIEENKNITLESYRGL
nr:hypothetical protein [Lachnospiraceae bacterium]